MDKDLIGIWSGIIWRTLNERGKLSGKLGRWDLTVCPIFLHSSKNSKNRVVWDFLPL